MSSPNDKKRVAPTTVRIPTAKRLKIGGINTRSQKRHTSEEEEEGDINDTALSTSAYFDKSTYTYDGAGDYEGKPIAKGKGFRYINEKFES